MMEIMLSTRFSRVMAILLADDLMILLAAADEEDDEEGVRCLCLAYDILLALNFLEGEPPPEEGSCCC